LNLFILKDFIKTQNQNQAFPSLKSIISISRIICIFVIYINHIKMPPASKKAKKQTAEYEIQYWATRGRAEVIRLTLALAGLEWTEKHVTDDLEKDTKAKAGTAEIPFGQWPLLVENGVVLCQTQAIVKHLGRQYGMYGSRSRMEDYLVDSFLMGTDAFRQHFSDLRWVHGDTPEAREKFEKKHLDKETKTGVNGGAHLAYLEGYLERSKTEWVSGSKKPSVADVFLFDLFDAVCNHFGPEKTEKLNQDYPKLAAHHKTFSEVEEVAEYLKSDKHYKN
jgi:glutathione S-transferase